MCDTKSQPDTSGIVIGFKQILLVLNTMIYSVMGITLKANDNLFLFHRNQYRYKIPANRFRGMEFSEIILTSENMNRITLHCLINHEAV